MSRHSLAASTDDAIGFGEQRVTSVRVFAGHIHRLGALALTEATIVALALHAGIFIRFSDFFSPLSAFESRMGAIGPKAAVIAAVFVLCLASLGLYQLRHRARFIGVFIRLLLALSIAQFVLALVFYLTPSLYIGPYVLAMTTSFALLGLMLSRYVFLRMVDEEAFKRRVLVWGSGPRAAAIGSRLRRRTDQRGFRIIGYVPAPGDGDSCVPREQLLPAAADLVRLALRHNIEEIVVAMEDRRQGFPTGALLEARLRGVRVTDLLAFLERESGRVNVGLMHPSTFIFSDGFRCDYLRLATKRAFDVTVSLTLLVLSSPIALLSALLVYLEDRGPIFYRQVRTGQNGKPFTIVKFRSMRVDAEAEGKPIWAKANDPRTTRVGAVIRQLRFDELPQLVNVLQGHMSFVGPRPERPEFVEQLAKSVPFYRQRHFVKPGITGWAQVRYSYGSSSREAQEKLEYDLYYVKHHSLAFDLAVLLQTVEIVVFRIGAR